MCVAADASKELILKEIERLISLEKEEDDILAALQAKFDA